MALLGHDVSAAMFVLTQEGGGGVKRYISILFLQLHEVIVLRRGCCRIFEITFLVTRGLLTIFHLVQAAWM